MEIGIHTFGELVADPHTHQKLSAHESLKQVIQMAILADEVGLDILWRRRTSSTRYCRLRAAIYPGGGGAGH